MASKPDRPPPDRPMPDRAPATIRQIEGRPILWTDEAGATHRCEGADIHRGVRLIWTDCGRDVPANPALLPGDDDRVSCAACLAAGLWVRPAS
jgi:hypothetical protein